MDAAPGRFLSEQGKQCFPSVLLTVSGDERAPGTAGVNLEVSRQSVVVSELVVHAGVPSDHSLDASANAFVAAWLSAGMK